MVHERQGLALGLEPGQHLPAIHARFDQLEGHPPPHGLMLLGHEDDPHAALADLLQQLIRTDLRAGFLQGRLIDGDFGTGSDRGRRILQKVTCLLTGCDEGVHLRPQIGITTTHSLDEKFPVFGRSDFQGIQENVVGARVPVGHFRPLVCSSDDRQCEIR